MKRNMIISAKAFRLSLLFLLAYLFTTNYCVIQTDGILIIPKNVPQFIAISVKTYYVDAFAYSFYYKCAIIGVFYLQCILVKHGQNLGTFSELLSEYDFIEAVWLRSPEAKSKLFSAESAQAMVMGTLYLLGTILLSQIALNWMNNRADELEAAMEEQELYRL